MTNGVDGEDATATAALLLLLLVALLLALLLALLVGRGFARASAYRVRKKRLAELLH